jgi:hypothetical protein
MNGGRSGAPWGPHFPISDIGSSAYQNEGDIKLVQCGGSLQYDVGVGAPPPIDRRRFRPGVIWMQSFRTLKHAPEVGFDTFGRSSMDANLEPGSGIC